MKPMHKLWILVVLLAMGLAATPGEATAKRAATPKIAFVSPPQSYVASDGKPVRAEEVDLTARRLSSPERSDMI